MRLNNTPLRMCRGRGIMEVEMDDGERLNCCADLTPDCVSVQQPSLSLQSILLTVIL